MTGGWLPVVRCCMEPSPACESVTWVRCAEWASVGNEKPAVCALLCRGNRGLCHGKVGFLRRAPLSPHPNTNTLRTAWGQLGYHHPSPRTEVVPEPWDFEAVMWSPRSLPTRCTKGVKTYLPHHPLNPMSLSFNFEKPGKCPGPTSLHGVTPTVW